MVDIVDVLVLLQQHQLQFNLLLDIDFIPGDPYQYLKVHLDFSIIYLSILRLGLKIEFNFFMEMIFDDPDQFYRKSFLEILEVGEPLENILPFVAILIEMRQILDIFNDIISINNIVTDFIDKFIEEVF
jgi:hypothetical protein